MTELLGIVWRTIWIVLMNGFIGFYVVLMAWLAYRGLKVCTEMVHSSGEESGTSNPFRFAPRIFVPALRAVWGLSRRRVADTIIVKKRAQQQPVMAGAGR